MLLLYNVYITELKQDTHTHTYHHYVKLLSLWGHNLDWAQYQCQKQRKMFKTTMCINRSSLKTNVCMKWNESLLFPHSDDCGWESRARGDTSPYQTFTLLLLLLLWSQLTVFSLFFQKGHHLHLNFSWNMFFSADQGLIMNMHAGENCSSPPSYVLFLWQLLPQHWCDNIMSFYTVFISFVFPDLTDRDGVDSKKTWNLQPHLPLLWNINAACMFHCLHNYAPKCSFGLTTPQSLCSYDDKNSTGSGTQLCHIWPSWLHDWSWANLC